MADKKISQYDPIVAPALTDIHEVVQGGVNYKETKQQLSDLLNLNFFGVDFKQLINNPFAGVFWFSDFMLPSAEVVFGVAGAGASAQVGGSYGQDTTNKAIGVMRVHTGTTSIGRSEAFINLSDKMPVGLGRHIGIHRIAVEALSDVTEEFRAYCGWSGNYVTVMGGYWEYDRVNYGDFWTCVNGYTPKTRTVTSIPVTTGYIWLAVDTKADWSEIKFYYSTNGTTWTLAATHTTNIPTTGLSSYLTNAINKKAGTTQRNCSADLCLFAYFFNR